MSSAPRAQVGFSVGAGAGMVSWPTVALIARLDQAHADRIWGYLVAGADAHDLLEELSSGGLRDLGSFVVAQQEGDQVRFFVRGGAQARFETDRGQEVLDGSSVRTWIEHVAVDCRSFDLAIEGAIDADTAFRVSGGFVPAGRLVWSADSPPPGADVANPATSATPNVDVVGPTVDDPAPAAPADDPESGDDAETQGESDQGEVSTPADVIDTGQTLHYGSLDPLPETVEEPAANNQVAEPAVEATEEEPEPEPEPEPYDYDALFGRTTYRSVQDAAVPESEPEDLEPEEPVLDPPEPVPSPPPGADEPQAMATSGGLISGVPTGPSAGEVASPSAEEPGDHDGLTMTVAQLRALRAAGGQPDPSPSASQPSGGASVQALVCAAGHPNPTVLDTCRECDAPLESVQVVVERPSLGRVRLSTGEVIELERPVIVGRNPRVEGTMHGEVPKMFKIEGMQALSRSHAIIRLEGWQVLLEDLDSANGTTVTLDGRPPRRLRIGEPAILEHGALIDFGGEVTGTYDARSTA